ncbi:MAG: alpha-galactosidase, partial [Candidatus Scatosoma sp.]
MIIYNREWKAFLLSGKNCSYAMYVNRHGLLQNLHFGAKIGAEDLAYLVRVVGEADVPAENDLNKDLAYNRLPSECGFYGHGDYREPTVLTVREDGAAMSRLRYRSHKIFAGVPESNGNMPVARSVNARTGKSDTAQTLAVTLKDDSSAAEITLYYTVYDDCDVLVRNLAVKNTGGETFTVKRAFSFCLELPKGNYSSLRLGGTWAQERIPEIAPIAHGITKLSTLRGASSHTTNPFMGILKDGCGEEEGECYGVQLIYSGSFCLTCENERDTPLRVQGGVSDFNFTWKLQGGETFVTPQAALCFSAEGLGGMSRAYADFLRMYVINPAFVFAPRPVVINNWEATYFNFDNEKLFPIIDEAAKLGLDTFVLDDGWFGKRNNDTAGLGDWFANEEKLAGGLDTIIGYCKNKGLKFGLWFEPEMINEDSDLYRAHPEFAAVKAGETPTRSRNQLILDFSNAKVVDYIYGMISDILKKHDIRYVKWDMNRNFSEYYSPALPAERQGEFPHRYILGVYDLAARMTSEFPKVFFEGCAGGGGRFDAGMLYYFPQIWTSDDSDAYERAKIQWGTSLCYPLSSMSCHVSVCPNHLTGRITPFQTRGVIASLG